MSLYIKNNNQINSIFINVEGEKKTVKSIWVNKNGIATKVFYLNSDHVEIVTWSGGSDEQIAAMLDAHYNGDINIHDYWHVGDERTVHLSAMTAGAVDETHVEQDVTMVLMNEGGKTLVEPVNGISECAFVVGQKNCLADYKISENGYMNSSTTNSGGWDSCQRRTWCNETYRNAFPASIRALFKQHYNVTAIGAGTAKVASEDYFALASEKEIFGSTKLANATAEAENTQFEYYKTSSNRIKKCGDIVNSYIASTWLARSPSERASTHFCYVNYSSINENTNEGVIKANGYSGIAPFGCI